MDYFQVRSFDRYQHYKTGKNLGASPSWIKLYLSLRSDPEFTTLSPSDRWHLVGIFLLAAERNNKLPVSYPWLTHELRSPDVDISRLEHWLEGIDGATLSPPSEKAILGQNEKSSLCPRTILGLAEGESAETPVESEESGILGKILEQRRGEEKRVEKKTTTTSRQVPGAAGEVLRAFDVNHRRVLHLPYLSQVGRDRKVLQEPLRVYGKPLVLEMVDAFWHAVEKAQQGESYTGKAKPSVPAFVNTIPSLIRDYTFDSKPSQAR